MVAAAAAAVALTGWRIDYVGNWSGRQAIYSVDASGRGPADVLAADGAADVTDPRPSPDGSRLLYDEHGETVVAEPDGHAYRALWVPTPGMSLVGDAWSPDSTRIAYLVQDVHGAALHVVRPDGTGDRVVQTVGGSAPLRITWSRDGRRARAVIRTDTLASPDGRWHVVFRSGVPQGFVVARAGTSRPAVSDAGGWLTWSPDSRLLAYTTSRGIVVLDLRTKRSRLLTSDLGSQLTWAPDGSALAYVDCCASSTVGVGDVRTVTRAGKVRVVESRSTAGVVTGLAWARSARGVVYRRAPSDLPGVFTIAPVSQLAADGGRAAFAACGRLFLWAPADDSVAAGPSVTDCDPFSSFRVYTLALAGDHVAYGVMCCNNVRSWTLSSDVFGESPQLLLEGGGDVCCTSYPVLAGHGSLIAYADRSGATDYTWTLHTPGGQPLISFEQNRFVPVALDVDGDRILVARDGAVDVVLSENGGTVVHLDLPDLHPPQAQLDGPTVDVLADGVLDIYATDGGELLHSWPAPYGATLLDAGHGLAALTADGEISVIRVADGLRARIAPGSLAAFMDDGLAVANGARVSLVPAGQLPS